jgi:hypothetical protein
VWDFVRVLLVSTAWAVALFVVANLYAVVAANASPGTIAVTVKLRRLLRTASRQVTFRSDRGRVLVTTYDAARDEEVEQQLYHTTLPVLSFTRWSGGNRTVAFLLRRTAMDLVLRVVLFTAVVLPVFGLAGWLTVTVHWTWVYLVVALAAHHVVNALTGKFVFYKSLGLFTGLVAVLVFHSKDWLPFRWEVAVSLLFGWVLLSSAALVWVERS